MKKAAASAIVVVLILMFPQASVDGARNAMMVWCRSVAPALFPFFVLMPMLTNDDACEAYERLFSNFMKRLFRLPGAAAPAMLVSVLSGSPAGAIAITRVAASGKLTKNDAKRMAMALCGLSPSFLILGIGQELYGSVKIGWMLAIIQFVTQLMILFITRGMSLRKDEKTGFTAADCRLGIQAAIESILVVCGYMVLFGAISAVMTSIIGMRFGNLVLLALDMPGGSAALSKMDIGGKMGLQLGAVGFGGVCIAFQNMDVLKRVKVSWKDYLAGRALSTMICICIGIMAPWSKIAVVSGWLTGKGVNVYAIILLFACVGILPWIYSMQKKLFLNKRKEEYCIGINEK